MPEQKSTVKLVTLGCPKNTVDSEQLALQLQSNGWELTPESAEAEVAVINTCGFIDPAKRESVETILRAVEDKRRGLLRKVIVMGCLSERYMKELRAEIPEVDAYVGANRIDRVIAEIGGALKHELLGERLLSTPQHFAYLKISEGCDRPCSFCSIPLMRGRHVSKPFERVITEARRLALLGVKELIIIAQDSTYYGLDLYGKRRLAELLEALAAVDGIEWIRLMYAFPTGFPSDLLDQFGMNPKLCRYLDMPVQHCSDAVLSSMRRGISGTNLRGLIGRIRREVPDITLRTTLIVGYPTEGEREFGELCDFVREIRFDRLGVFAYSREEGTVAFDLGDPVPAGVKEARLATVMELQQAIAAEKNSSLIGSKVRVLVDSVEGDGAFGRTRADAPEIDDEVTIHDAGAIRVGQFCDVEIVDAEAYDLYAIPAGSGRVC